jgi:hypothetical protein
MNNAENNLKRAAERMTLTPDEQSAMRLRVQNVVEGGIVRIPSAPRRIQRPGWITNFIPQTNAMPIFIALLLLSLGAGGTSMAAQNALPGDALYGVKIHVNDEVRSMFAISPEAKAKIQTILADERLKEAEALAAKSALDPAKLQTITDNLNEHLQSAKTLTDEVKAKDAGVAKDLEKTAKDMLGQHSDALTKIAGQSESDDDSAVESLQKEVGDHRGEFKGEDDEDEDDAAVKLTPPAGLDAGTVVAPTTGIAPATVATPVPAADVVPTKLHEVITAPGTKTEIQKEGDHVEINTEKTDDKDDDKRDSGRSLR